MGQRILVVDSRHMVCRGLRAFFLHEMPDALIEVKTSLTSLQMGIATQMYDLMVVNQLFLREISHIIKENMVVLAAQPDKEIFLAAREHRAKAYLNDDPSEHLLHQVLTLKPGDFLIDPAFSHWVIEHTGEYGRSRMQMELLTTKEREVAELLNKELSYRQIADRLSIAESTARRHAANIRAKMRRA